MLEEACVVCPNSAACLRLSECQQEKFYGNARFEVVGRSGRMYEVPKEVWDLIGGANKRIIRAS